MAHSKEHDFDSTLLPLAKAEGSIEHDNNLDTDDTQPYPGSQAHDPGDAPRADMGDEPEVMA